MKPKAVAHPLFVDAHVHIHACFDLRRFLDGAALNVRAAAAALGLPPSTPGCLLLTDYPGSRGFERVRSVEAETDWTLADAGPGAVLISREGSPQLLVAAGSQLRTAERLEVLALLTEAPLADGLPLAAAIDTVRDAGGIAVVPWGFGKWTLRRGSSVRNALQRPDPPFLGDNGGRLRLRTPPLLRLATRAGVPILPGSDPLPFRDHERRAGSCGFVADLRLDGASSADRLRDWLRGLGSQPTVHGTGRGAAAFIRDQVRMQLRRR